MTDFQDKLAVVFGGGRDIGGAIAVELARRGAHVSLSYHGSNPDKVVDAITALGHKPYAQKVDAMDMAAVRTFAASSSEQAGKKISTLVNVVGGLIARKRMEEMDDAFWDQVMTLNTKSIFAMTQAALPLMTDGGAIVNVSSQAGRDGGGPGGIAYGPQREPPSSTEPTSTSMAAFSSARTVVRKALASSTHEHSTPEETK